MKIKNSKDKRISEVGEIGNHYGGLSVMESEGKHFWSIENYDGHDWQEIPEYLYRSILKFEDDH